MSGWQVAIQWLPNVHLLAALPDGLRAVVERDLEQIGVYLPTDQRTHARTLWAVRRHQALLAAGTPAVLTMRPAGNGVYVVGVRYSGVIDELDEDLRSIHRERL